jgi:hypothetical protein
MRQTVRFGPIYGGPACGDHLRGVVVSVHDHSAGCASRRFPVPAPELPATRADSGGVPRGDKFGPDPLGGHFIGDEVLELTERPVRLQSVPVLVGNLGSDPDPLEILLPDERAALPKCASDLMFGAALGDRFLIGPGQGGAPWKGAFPLMVLRDRGILVARLGCDGAQSRR